MVMAKSAFHLANAGSLEVATMMTDLRRPSSSRSRSISLHFPARSRSGQYIHIGLGLTGHHAHERGFPTRSRQKYPCAGRDPRGKRINRLDAVTKGSVIRARFRGCGVTKSSSETAR